MARCKVDLNTSSVAYTQLDIQDDAMMPNALVQRANWSPRLRVMG